jgi:hypothetical protein
MHFGIEEIFIESKRDENTVKQSSLEGTEPDVRHVAYVADQPVMEENLKFYLSLPDVQETNLRNLEEQVPYYS